MGVRETYIAKLKEQLSEWSMQIEILEIKSEQANIELRMECNKQLAELRAKRDQASDQVFALQNATEEAWDEVKKGSETVLNVVKATFRDAKSKFNDKYNEEN